MSKVYIISLDCDSSKLKMTPELPSSMDRKSNEKPAEFQWKSQSPRSISNKSKEENKKERTSKKAEQGTTEHSGQENKFRKSSQGAIKELFLS